MTDPIDAPASQGAPECERCAGGYAGADHQFVTTTPDEREDPRTWKSGQFVLHRSGSVHELASRKDDDSGWWIVGGGGLADRVATSSDWLLLTRERIAPLFEEPTKA